MLIAWMFVVVLTVQAAPVLMAGGFAPIYERSEEKTKRSYNLAFFEKIYVLPEFSDRLECTGAQVVLSEMTEPYAVLLANDLAASVVA